MRACLPCLLALVALVLAPVIRASEAEDALIKWVHDNGGQVHVEISRSEAVRGTFAPKAIAEGEYLAIIPLELAFHLPESGSAGEMGVHLLREMANQDSFHAPYWGAMPAKEDVGLNYETFPDPYLDLLESQHLADQVRGYKDSTSYVWDEVKDALREEIDPELDISDLRYHTALVTTRYFGYNNQSYMIPIIDMANHDNRCPHWHQLTDCEEGSSERQCFVWVAGKALAKGEEVCNTYGVLRNDESLLQYGFILPDDPPNLCAVDYHDYSPDVKSHRGEDLPHFSGNTEEMRAEAERLAELRATLGEYDAQVAGELAAVEGDEEGAMLSSVLAFQQLRREAIKAELDRLAAELDKPQPESQPEVEVS